jgi:hypothetical protein
MVGINAGFGETITEEMVTSQRTAQEMWTGDHIVRFWTTKLMYASGFPIGSLSELNQDLNPANLVPGTKGIGAHKGLSEKRLEDDDLTIWLNDRYQDIADKSHFRTTKKNSPAEGEVWTWSLVSTFTKDFLAAWFNIKCQKADPVQKKRKFDEMDSSVVGDGMGDAQSIFTVSTTDSGHRNVSRKKGHRSGYSCKGHFREDGGDVVKCKVMRINEGSLSTMLSSACCFLNAPSEKAPTLNKIKARKEVARIMKENNVKNVMESLLVNVTTDVVAGEVNETPNGEDENFDCGNFNTFMDNQGEVAAFDDFNGGGSVSQSDVCTQGSGERFFVNELAGIETITEKKMKQKKMMAQIKQMKSNDAEKQKALAARLQVVGRYTGCNPYGLTALEFIVYMQSRSHIESVRRYIKRNL